MMKFLILLSLLTTSSAFAQMNRPVLTCNSTVFNSGGISSFSFEMKEIVCWMQCYSFTASHFVGENPWSGRGETVYQISGNFRLLDGKLNNGRVRFTLHEDGSASFEDIQENVSHEFAASECLQH
jgi:hypothetical protein